MSAANNRSQTGVALFAGLLFGIGLSIGGMTSPDTVRNFLNVTGEWDPRPALVLLGALSIFAPTYWLIAKRMKAPVWAAKFDVPPPRAVDKTLLLGSALFGAGWAVAGWCPGPAVAGLASLPQAVMFVIAMMTASLAAKELQRRLALASLAPGAQVRQPQVANAPSAT